MTYFSRFAITTLLLPTLAAACAVSVEDNYVEPTVTVEDTSSSPSPSASEQGDSDPIASSDKDPVYFGHENSLSDETDLTTPPSYTFELIADASITIELKRRTKDAPKTIGFTLHRITTDKKDIELGKAWGYDGSVAMSLYTVHGGMYAIRLLDGVNPESLVLNLSCNSGTCAPARQPGEVCGTNPGMRCDKGLVCLFAKGMCAMPEDPGRCHIPPEDCPASYAPVCGCDGKTWGNACFAKQAGVSLLHDGECK